MYTIPSKNNWSMPLSPSTYRPIRIDTLALPNLHIHDLLQFLFNTYGRITTTDLSNNSNCIKLPWDPTTPFEMLIDQIEECIEFADTRNLPFTVAQILNTASDLVFNTGSFFEDCKKWKAHPNNKKAWDSFKTHFLQLQNKRWLQQQTTQMSGYMSTNATHTLGPPDITENAPRHFQRLLAWLL